jgi:hypothetical protein
MEIFDLRKLVHTEDGAIDELTGELLFYESVKSTHADICANPRHYYEARDIDELLDIVSRYGEKRYSNVVYYLDKVLLDKWYIPILTLCSKVVYFNVGFYDREYLCSLFKVTDSNLNKTLNKFVKIGLFRYSGKGLTKPQSVRITWNPINVWKGWEDSRTKSVAIQDWYKGYFGGVETKNVPVFCDPNTKRLEDVVYENRISPDPYVSPYFHAYEKDRFKKLMNLTDAEFELFLLNIN